MKSTTFPRLTTRAAATSEHESGFTETWINPNSEILAGFLCILGREEEESSEAGGGEESGQGEAKPQRDRPGSVLFGIAQSSGHRLYASSGAGDPLIEGV